MSNHQTFSEKLKQILDEKGIAKEDELVHLVRLARKVMPDFSMRRLILLRRGFAPTKDDIRALSFALDVHPREFITDQDSLEVSNHKLALEFASDSNRMGRPDLAEEFARFVSSRINFRDKTLNTDDLYHLSHQFLDEGFADET